MTRRAWGNTTDRILLSLLNDGPSTSLQLATELGMRRDQVAPVLSRLQEPLKRRPNAGQQRVHICAWHWESVAGARAHLRPIYAIGPGVAPPKPPARKPRRRKKDSADG